MHRKKARRESVSGQNFFCSVQENLVRRAGDVFLEIFFSDAIGPVQTGLRRPHRSDAGKREKLEKFKIFIFAQNLFFTATGRLHGKKWAGREKVEFYLFLPEKISEIFCSARAERVFFGEARGGGKFKFIFLFFYFFLFL